MNLIWLDLQHKNTKSLIDNRTGVSSLSAFLVLSSCAKQEKEEEAKPTNQFIKNWLIPQVEFQGCHAKSKN